MLKLKNHGKGEFWSVRWKEPGGAIKKRRWVGGGC